MDEVSIWTMTLLKQDDVSVQSFCDVADLDFGNCEDSVGKAYVERAGAVVCRLELHAGISNLFCT